uniref:HdeD family acid-resistance protein n=1 Tax=Desulfobacca acetoxidans TaxID=60893 RepID=A0A7C3Z054_9BACT
MTDAPAPFSTIGPLGGYSLEDFQKNRGWFLALGIVLIIAGSLAIIYDVAATILSVLFFGWILVAVGAIEAVQSFWQPRWGGFFLHLFLGILAVVVGFHLVSSPAAGALILTFIMGMYFIVIGIFRFIAALSMRFPNWGWVALSGVISFILGLLIKQEWPYSGLWIIGLFIGIDLIFSGWSYVMLALAAKKLPAGQP